MENEGVSKTNSQTLSVEQKLVISAGRGLATIVLGSQHSTVERNKTKQ